MMKRQKLKVFCNNRSNSNKHSAHNLFAILFNRCVAIAIVLFLSLLPLNDAAPTAKSWQPQQNVEIKTQTSKIMKTTTNSDAAAMKTIDSDRMNNKIVLPPKFSSPFTSTLANRPEALSPLTSSSTPLSRVINDATYTNRDGIENNRDMKTIKTDLTTSILFDASSSNNHYSHKRSHSISTTEQSSTVAEVQSQLFALDSKTPFNDAKVESIASLSVANDNDAPVASTPSVSVENLSDLVAQNGPHENTADMVNSKNAIISSASAVDLSTSLSYNVASSTPTLSKKIDELSLNGSNQTELKSPSSQSSQYGNAENGQTNDEHIWLSRQSSTNIDNDGKAIDTITEYAIKSNEDILHTELGQSASTIIATTSASNAIKASSAINSTTMTTVKNIGIYAESKIEKSMNEKEEKSSTNNWKVKHENIGNNHKKYHNKNDKDKSKNESNEDDGVNDPHKKPNDDNVKTESTLAQNSSTKTKSIVVEDDVSSSSTTISQLENIYASNDHTPDKAREDSTLDEEAKTAKPVPSKAMKVNVFASLSTQASTSSSSSLPGEKSVTTTFINNVNPDAPLTTVNRSVATNINFSATQYKSGNDVMGEAFINIDGDAMENVYNRSSGNVMENVRDNGEKNQLNADDFVVETETALDIASANSIGSTKPSVSQSSTEMKKSSSTLPTMTTTLVLETAVKSPIEKQLTNDDEVDVKENKVLLKHSNDDVNDDNEMNYTKGVMNNGELSNTMAAEKQTTTTAKHNILDYDKSSEEIFDIVRETSTVKLPEVEKSSHKKPYELDSDEFFLPADDLDIDSTVTAAKLSTTTFNTPASKTQSIGLMPSIRTVPNTTPVATTIGTESKHQTIAHNKDESTVERDSDTIFYISNTEVKVVESSMPTPNSKQENQFFPALYEEDVIIDFHGKNNSGWSAAVGAGDKYEEDIILSPMKTNFDPRKLNEGDINLSYVGESFIDIKEPNDEESSALNEQNVATKDDIGNNDRDNAISSNVIIEPVVISDVSQSINVPVIAELPPQIDVRDLDYKSDAVQFNSSGDNTITSHLLMQAVDNLQKMQQLSAELPKSDSDEVVSADDANKRNETNRGNGTAEAISNVTAFSVLDDEPETNFNDIQTLAIASLSTLCPLLGCVVLLLGVRHMFRKVRRIRSCNTNGINGKGLLGDSSTDPLAMNSHGMSADELKSPDLENNGINHINDNLITDTDITTAMQYDEMTGGNINHHSNANGSLITMTMKNNHLIVETEERSDIARDVRETKVHYSPSEKDGVFVVEVARGADSNASGIKPHILPHNRIASNELNMTNELLAQCQNAAVEMIADVENQIHSVDYNSLNDGNNASCETVN